MYLMDLACYAPPSSLNISNNELVQLGYQSGVSWPACIALAYPKGSMPLSMCPHTSVPLDSAACLAHLYLCDAIASRQLSVMSCSVSLSTRGVFTVHNEVLCCAALLRYKGLLLHPLLHDAVYNEGLQYTEGLE